MSSRSSCRITRRRITKSWSTAPHPNNGRSVTPAKSTLDQEHVFNAKSYSRERLRHGHHFEPDLVPFKIAVGIPLEHHGCVFNIQERIRRGTREIIHGQ